MKALDIADIVAYLVLMAGMGFWFMRRNKARSPARPTRATSTTIARVRW